MKSRDRTVLCIVGLAGLAAALWFLALAPKRQEASYLAAKVTQAEARRDGANRKSCGSRAGTLNLSPRLRDRCPPR